MQNLKFIRSKLLSVILGVSIIFPSLKVWAISPISYKKVPSAIIKSCTEKNNEYRSYGFGKRSGRKGYSPSAPPPVAMKMPMPSPSSNDQKAPSEAGASIPPKPKPIPPKQDRELDVHQTAKQVKKAERKASELYLSNDDSMSLASAQRLIYAINNFLPVYQNEVRPHEFLNYFHFKENQVIPGDDLPQESIGPFQLGWEISPRPGGDTLAISVHGKTLNKNDRRPAVISLVLDKSGSMNSQGKMDYLQEGLRQLRQELKPGDVVNVVEFDNETCTAMQNFLVGRDEWKGYDQTVNELKPRGSTDLHKGLVEGYKLAEKSYDPKKINRVILITDAIANTGQLSPDLMASIGKYYDTKKIALSGIGVGLDFNDELLDKLTDQGKGAYLFLGMKEAIPRVFGSDFISLLDTVARNVHFKVTFPKDVFLEVFYGEEVSTDKAKVQPIHYFANSSQLFLLDLVGKAKTDDSFQLLVEYEDPITGQKKSQKVVRSVSHIKAQGQANIAKARLIMAFTELLEKTARPGKRPRGGWNAASRITPNQEKENGQKLCRETMEAMKKQSQIFTDEETKRVTELATKYCSRY